MNVSAWLHALAQEKVKEAGDALPERSLLWKRGEFAVRLRAGSSEVRTFSGIVAGPFGTYRGRGGKQDLTYSCFTLVHVPSGTPNASLKRLKNCKDLARQLYWLKLRWEATEAAQVTGPGIYEAQRLVEIYTKKHGPFES